MSGARTLLRILQAAQAHRLFRFGNRHNVAILLYHGLTGSVDEPGIRNNQGKHVHVAAFERHLAHLATHYQVVSLDAAVAGLAGQGRLPAHSIVITFDDGYESNWSLALPLLSKYQACATVFVTTDFVDNDARLWTDRLEYALGQAANGSYQVRVGECEHALHLTDRPSRLACYEALNRAIKHVPHSAVDAAVGAVETSVGCALGAGGPDQYRPLTPEKVRLLGKSGLVTIGCHTRTHAILTRCHSDEQAVEVRASKQRVEELTGSPCRFFAYPNGQPGDFDDGTTSLLRELGLSGACTTVPGVNRPGCNQFALNRLQVTNGRNDIEFAMNVAGLFSALRSVKAAFGAENASRRVQERAST